MTLRTYKKKRTFDETPEPKGKKKSSLSKNLPVFCVQKHAASRLHYDFRLECQGVMLSWAIPKGPSLDPNQKRLAVHVEDHPLDYRHFEGTIPEGNYGAGTVMIWDEGAFSVPNATTKKEIENALWKGFEKGHIEVDLSGTKLQGGFALIKIQSDESGKNWLFIKRKDANVDQNHDILDQDRSVRTDKTMSEISGKSEKQPKKKVLESIDAPKKKMPGFIKPMLATLIQEPFNDPEWIFEIKWDGYRALAYIDKKVNLYSRNKNSFNTVFSEIANDLLNLKAQAILDGEIVVLDAKGRSHFQLMQNYQRTKQGSLYYYVFDILYLNGRDLRELPLIERKKILETLLANSSLSLVRFSDHVEKEGKSFYGIAKKKQLEGIMAKKMNSPYVSQRTRDWLKIKTHRRQEAIIAGYTEPRGSRKNFGAVLLGVYDKNQELTYIGHVGGGFDQKLLESVFTKMEKLKQTQCPFKKRPKTKMPVTWVKPKLVCEVSFGEWTSDGIMRQPIFEGLRMDKPSRDVKKEKALPLKIPQEKPIKKNHPVKEKVSFTNLNKIYWPKIKLTKGDLLQYYQEVSDSILPYLKNRPLMIRRFPEGVEGGNFFQKDTGNLKLPSWIETIKIKHEKKDVVYFIIQNKESLEYIVNLGTIEMHPFLSQISTPQYPDYFVMDLDPEAISFDKVIETAKVIHEILDEFEITNVCKTSGKRGLHLCIPLGRKYTYEQVLQFGEIIAHTVHAQIPEFTSLFRQPSKRQKKVYLDTLQNYYTKTVVAPYSVRGTELATVSVPLLWSEVKKGLDPNDFNIKNVPARLKKLGDLFEPALKQGINLSTILKKMQKSFNHDAKH